MITCKKYTHEITVLRHVCDLVSILGHVNLQHGGNVVYYMCYHRIASSVVKNGFRSSCKLCCCSISNKPLEVAINPTAEKITPTSHCQTYSELRYRDTNLTILLLFIIIFSITKYNNALLYNYRNTSVIRHYKMFV